MNYDSRDYSFLCIFNFKRNSDYFSLYLLKLCEKIFRKFDYPIKKVFYSRGNKSNAPNYERFRELLNKNNGEYESVNFFSGTRYSVDSGLSIRIFDHTGFAIYNPNCKDQFTVHIIIKEQRLLDDIFFTYHKIVSIFSEFNQMDFSGYGFFFPKNFDGECLAIGIINASYSYSYDMLNLTHWNGNSNYIYSTIGFLGVFTNLDFYQTKFLCDYFSDENVIVVNNAVIYRYEKAIINTDYNEKKEESFFESSEYLELAKMFELVLPYKNIIK